MQTAHRACGGIRVIALVLAIIAAGSGGAAESATTSKGEPEIYFVPDVVGQFNALSYRPDGLTFGLGEGPEPTTCKHYQGVVRAHGPGVPYFFVSRSGNDPCFDPTEGDDAGNIVVVRMGSRDTNGERLRSNRLIRGWDPFPGWNGQPPVPPAWTKPGPAEDATVGWISLVGDGEWPAYGHPGGMQLVGDVLAVPLEASYGSSNPDYQILFVDVSNPEVLRVISSFPVPANPEIATLFPDHDYQAGLVGLTPVRNETPPHNGQRYLMITTGGTNRELRLYRSLPTDSSGNTDLMLPDVAWEEMGTWFCPPGTDCTDRKFPGGWPTGGTGHQSMNFVREGSLDGPLYVIGNRNTFFAGNGDDFLDLYRVNVDVYGVPEEQLLTRVASKDFTSYPYNGHGDSAAFIAAGGVYVSPSGELIFYSTEYENQGPRERNADGSRGKRDTVRFGEWRHRDIVRDGSPTLRPSVELDAGPYEVDEGGSIVLSGRGAQPITKAWIQLYKDFTEGRSYPEEGWMTVDFSDRYADYFDRLDYFDQTTDTDFNNETSSWRWFAPVRCTLRANGGTFTDPVRSKTLRGNGFVNQADLDDVRDDANSGTMNDMISSIQFDDLIDEDACSRYYEAPITLAWDFDSDGVFETPGDAPLFMAFELDGPGAAAISAIARHPIDDTHLGVSDPKSVTVTVRNVAPAIETFTIVDPVGNALGSDATGLLPLVPYAVRATFTDPGRPDRQSAALDLGDGTVLVHAAFDVFTDAFGGATGVAEVRHAYQDVGTYGLRLDIEDDDLGRATATASATVISATDATCEIFEELEALIASAPNDAVRSALTTARDRLGRPVSGGSASCDREHLGHGSGVALLTRMRQAIDDLDRAEAAGGGDLSDTKARLGLGGAAIAERVHLDAASRVAPASPAQAAELARARVSITEGYGALTTRSFGAALDAFREGASIASAIR